jgi:hypothetical protein
VDDLDALHLEVHQIGEAIDSLHNTQRIFEQALLKTLEDIESLSDTLVDAGILQVEEDTEEVEDLPLTDDDVEADPEDIQLAAPDVLGQDDGKLVRVVVDSDNPANETEVEETQEERDARIAAVRARRMAAVERQAEAANESDPIEAETDPNAITDVPEEGIVVDPGKDEPVMLDPDSVLPGGPS